MPLLYWALYRAITAWVTVSVRRQMVAQGGPKWQHHLELRALTLLPCTHRPVNDLKCSHSPFTIINQSIPFPRFLLLHSIFLFSFWFKLWRSKARSTLTLRCTGRQRFARRRAATWTFARTPRTSPKSLFPTLSRRILRILRRFWIPAARACCLGFAWHSCCAPHCRWHRHSSRVASGMLSPLMDWSNSRLDVLSRILYAKYTNAQNLIT